MSNQNKLDSLQYIRAFAAIWVLITHVLQHLNIKPWGYLLSGQYGVDVFFILSGFIIYLTTKADSNWKVFTVKRLFRIYPVYIIALLLYGIYSYDSLQLTSISVIKNLLMCPWRNTIGYRSLIVGQAWSTCYELYFYFTMGVLLYLGVTKKYIIPLLSVLFIFGFILNKVGGFECGFGKYIYSLIVSVHIFKFCICILFAMFYNSLKKINIHNSLYGVIFSGVQVFFLYVLFSKYNNLFIAILSSSLFFVVWLLANEKLKQGVNEKVHKFIVYLGDISFSMYLIHNLVIKVLLYQFSIDSFLILLIGTFALTFIMSHFLYKYVEILFINKAQKISQKIISK